MTLVETLLHKSEMYSGEISELFSEIAYKLIATEKLASDTLLAIQSKNNEEAKKAIMTLKKVLS